MSAPSRRAATVAWVALLATPVLFAGVAMAATPPRHMRSPELAPVLLWMSAAVAGLGVALSRLLPPRIHPRQPGQPDAVAFTRLLVAWAILEGAALFPLVAELVTGSPALYGLWALVVAAQASLFPSAERWKDWSVQTLRSGGPGPGVRS